MKKALAMVICGVLCIAVFVAANTINGEGLTVDAVLYDNKADSLIDAITDEDYKTAAKYLSFCGSDNVADKREEWAQDMEKLDIDVLSENHNHLSGDDGLTKTTVAAYFADGTELNFDVIVQGKGLGIAAVYVTGNDELTEKYQQAMTSYNPG